MSVVEDSRKVLQDFIAPELREVSARLDALEKRFDAGERRNEKRFDQVDKRFDFVDMRFNDMDKKIDEIDLRAQKRHEQVMIALNYASELHALRDRVARLEAGEQRPQ